MISFCISTHNNLPYLKLAVESVRKNSYYKNAPFIIHAENCSDGTDEWLISNEYNLEYYIEKNETPVGIGGGMNFCADKVETKYIMFLHSDFYVSKNWDVNCLSVMEEAKPRTWVFSHRIEPEMFPGSQSRPGTVMVPKETFGAYYHDFNKELFEEYAYEFGSANMDYFVPKAEGVSGLISKEDWDAIGGNDPIFAPASYEDMDLFLRMKQAGYNFILTGASVVWHFGARGSHRLEENNGQTSQRQRESEQKNIQKWLQKWGSMPKFDEYGMITL